MHGYRDLALLAAALVAAGSVRGQEQPRAGASAALPAGAPEAMALIDRDDLRVHASHLASDDLGGRYTGSDGQRMAAEYVAQRFRDLGLEPLGDKARGGKRGYFQSYPLECTYLDLRATSLEIGAERVTAGFAVLPGKKNGKIAVAGTFAFCGDGSPDELPKGGLSRRIPVVVLDERTSGPRQDMGSTRALQRASAVVRELERRGARVALFCLLGQSSAVADAVSSGALQPGKPLLVSGSGRSPSLRRADLPMVFLGRPLALRLLQSMGVETAGGGAPAASAEGDAKGRVELSVREDPKFSADNVVACLPGAHDRLGQEAVVFSAHMDHLGTRIDGDVFNGADDNASGTAGLLEIAEAFAGGEAPRRTVIFLAVSGEELGLFGSAHFADHPTWNLDRIVADVNIDMIGRATPLSGAEAVSVTPSHGHRDYSTLVRSAAGLAERLGLSLTVGDEFYRRSDHYNFARKGIPVVFFCDGEHPDYHRVTDDADKLDYVKIERVARLAYWTGFTAAQDPGRPQKLGAQPGW